MRTSLEIAKEIIAKNRQGSHEDWVQNIIKGLEEYKNQGNFFTPDDIAKIQSSSYDAGYSAGLQDSIN